MLALGGLTLGLSIGSLTAAGARTAGTTLNILYTSAKSLQVKLSDGTPVGPGAPLAAGSYTVLVYDDPGTDPNPKLTINGPGVSASSDLNSTGMGIDQPATIGPLTFQAGASYTVEDTTIGASSLITFATTSGSTGNGSTSTGSPSTTVGGQPTTTTATTTSPHAKTVKMAGALKGSVSASGKATLSLGGKSVKTLKAGLYSLAVVDQSKKAGLIVGELGRPPITISGAAAVGTSTHTLNLGPGKGFFEPSSNGPRTYFTVTA